MFTNTDQLEYALNFMSTIFDLPSTQTLSHFQRNDMLCLYYDSVLCSGKKT